MTAVLVVVRYALAAGLAVAGLEWLGLGSTGQDVTVLVLAGLGALVGLLRLAGESCETCGARPPASRVVAKVAYRVGAASAFASGSYRGARLARDWTAVSTGRVGNRIVNKFIGRTIVSRLYRR